MKICNAFEDLQKLNDLSYNNNTIINNNNNNVIVKIYFYCGTLIPQE